MSNQPIKTLIVDDSKLMRKAVKNIFADYKTIKVVGEAENGLEALELLNKVSPDVVVLDINMPEMDGLTTLKHMMIQNPVPTVMLSTLTKEGSTVAFDSLKYGAVDFVTKPSSLKGNDLQEQKKEIVGKVKASANVKIDKVKYLRLDSHDSSFKVSSGIEPDKIIAMGAAEGGYGTLLKTIPQLPHDLPAAYIVVLHVATSHVEAFVRYLDQCSAVKVKHAVEDEPVEGGVCYLCSGEEYITIREKHDGYHLHVSPAPFSTRRGSVDMMMFSVAELVGKHSVGVILSGEGNDGAEGLCEIIATGGSAIVQNPQSSLYKKMPKTALSKCSESFVVADSKIASAINMCCS